MKGNLTVGQLREIDEMLTISERVKNTLGNESTRQQFEALVERTIRNKIHSYMDAQGVSIIAGANGEPIQKARTFKKKNDGMIEAGNVVFNPFFDQPTA